jgi:MFS family permease
MKKSGLGKDIWFLLVESALTNFILFMPVAYLLFSDIGLNQFQIGLSQFTFAITLLLLDVPTGYFADRVSRKVSNASGDLFLALGVFCYIFVSSLWHVVIAEVIFGIGHSLTSGADAALLKAHAEDRGLSYRKLASRMQSLGFVMNGVGAIAGAIIGASNIRWSFMIQTVIFLVAAMFAFRIRNAGKKRKTTKHPVRDLATIIKYCLHGHPRLAWRILLSACLMSTTLLVVWFLTPSFLAAGYRVELHGFLFAAISAAAIFGSEFYVQSKKLKPITPFLIAGAAYLVMGWKLTTFTVLIFLLTSFARGINTARYRPFIQEIAPDDIQATAVSVYGMVYRVFSSSLLLLVNFLGNIQLRYGLFASGAVCLVFWAFFRMNERKYI